MSLLFNVDGLHVKRNDLLESRRYGRVMFSNCLLRDGPDVIQKLYSKIIPVSVTYDYAREIFEITALSEHFDSVEEMYTIPYYAVNVRKYKRNKGGTGVAYYLDFIKIEDK